MGFNNGYDSGYSDCEAENRKRWEREAVERYKAENPPSGGGSTPAPTTRAAAWFTPSNTLFFETEPAPGSDQGIGLGSFSEFGTEFLASSNPTGLTRLACSCPLTVVPYEGFSSHVFPISIEEPAGGWVEGDILTFCWYPAEGASFTIAGQNYSGQDGSGFYGSRYNGSSFERFFFYPY